VSGVLIAPAVAAHLQEIPGIELAAAAIFSEADLPQDIRYKVTESDDLREALQQERLWVATSGQGGTVGFAMADVVDGQAYLVEINVLPDFSRQGIGTQLVNTVLAWARRQELATLWLVTFRHLPWNAPFYAKLGFSVVDPAEHGDELAGLIEEEGRIGINIDNRVAMKISC
jgi:GNAT superfamily N-acetyltransferase